MSFYDPRIDMHVNETKNEILILAEVMLQAGFVNEEEKGQFWRNIAYLADCADEQIKKNGNGNGNGHKPKRIPIVTKTKSKLKSVKKNRKKKLDDQKALVRQKFMPDKAA